MSFILLFPQQAHKNKQGGVLIGQQLELNDVLLSLAENERKEHQKSVDEQRKKIRKLVHVESLVEPQLM